MHASGDTDIRQKKASRSILQIQELQNYLEIDTLKELQLLTNKEELLHEVKAKGSLGCSEHGAVEFSDPGRSEQDKEQDYSHRLQMSRFQGPAWQNLWEIALESRGAEELAHLQGRPPQSIRRVHYNVQTVEQLWQKASTDGHGAPE